MRVYWWRGPPNFGDRLTPIILERFAGVRAEWSPADKAELVVVGSILGHVPKRGFRGAILGAGKANRTTRLNLARADVLALRGQLTAVRSRARRVQVFGDPGLLCSLMAPDVSKRHDLGIIAHHADTSLESRFRGLRISVRDPVDDVIAQAASCRSIVTSSLHGVILADSLGIPRRWETFPRVQGGGFKFLDYATSLNEEIVPGRMAAANGQRVDAIRARLLKLFEGLRG